MNLYIQNISKGFTDTIFTTLLEFVSGDEKKERINSYTRKEDSWRTLAGDILSRYALGKYMGIDPKSIRFDYNENGKPFVVGKDRIYFNLSHSGDIIVCGVSSKPIGVDVEKIRPMRMSMANKICTGDELIMLTHLPQPQEQLLRLWSLKESYVKATGTGLSANVKTVNFDLSEQKIKSNQKSWDFQLLNLIDDYIIATCTMVP